MLHINITAGEWQLSLLTEGVSSCLLLWILIRKSVSKPATIITMNERWKNPEKFSIACLKQESNGNWSTRHLNNNEKKMKGRSKVRPTMDEPESLPSSWFSSEVASGKTRSFQERANLTNSHSRSPLCSLSSSSSCIFSLLPLMSPPERGMNEGGKMIADDAGWGRETESETLTDLKEMKVSQWKEKKLRQIQ